MNPRLSISLAVAATLSASALAHAALSRTGDAQVQFTASGPAGMSIVGTTNELTVSETDKEIVVVVPLRGLDTKIELRNKHMREKYLEVDRYPNAELRVAKDAVQKNAASGQATGQLTIHGQTKPTTFTYTSKPAGAGSNVTGALRLNIKDFGIKQPGYAGITVKPDVNVTVSFSVVEK